MPGYRNFRYRVEEQNDKGEVVETHYFCTIKDIADVYGYQVSTISKSMIHEGTENKKVKFYKMKTPLPAFKNVPLNYDKVESEGE
jgi:hypothetical protein